MEEWSNHIEIPTHPPMFSTGSYGLFWSLEIFICKIQISPGQTRSQTTPTRDSLFVFRTLTIYYQARHIHSGLVARRKPQSKQQSHQSKQDGIFFRWLRIDSRTIRTCEWYWMDTTRSPIFHPIISRITGRPIASVSDDVSFVKARMNSGILEVAGMEKHLVMERNRFFTNWVSRDFIIHIFI